MSIYNPVGPGGREKVKGVLDLIESGDFNIEALIRKEVTGDEITELYADLAENHSSYLGVIIDWQ